MTDWSGGLYTLPGEALTILRFFASAATESAHAEAIVEATGLTDRGFGKGIRRLVTRNYLTMTSAQQQVYRLTEQGRRAVRELNEAGDLDDGGQSMDDADDQRFVRRRLVLVAPAVMPAEQGARLIIGFDDPDDEERLDTPSGVLLRLNILNGEPSRPVEVPLTLENEFARHDFVVTAGAFTTMRVRAEVFQSHDGFDYEFCGGMYLDLPVQRTPTGKAVVPRAYGVDVILREPSG